MQMPETIKRFLWGFLPVFAISMIYMPIVYFAAPDLDATTATLLSNPALSIFQLIAVPFMAGVLAVALRPGELVGNNVLARGILLVVSIFGVVGALYLVVGDSDQALNNRVIEPIEWRDTKVRGEFFNLDKDVRNAHKNNTELCKGLKDGAKKE